MKFEQFRSFVEANASSYKGYSKETVESLADSEFKLGVSLPKSLKWLLLNWGYSFSAGIDSLDSLVEDTVRCRESIAMPSEWLILNDWGDSGVVLLRADEAEVVIWCDSCDVKEVVSGQAKGDCYSSFAEWSMKRFEDDED